MTVRGRDFNARNQKQIFTIRQRRTQIVVRDGDGGKTARSGGFNQRLDAASSVQRGARVDMQVSKQFHLCPPR